ncbi:unnamed protein product [Cyprideis torosa]|uniref:DNA-directed RNA polymerases I, II, and III subunit RPABC2 n=1 Tax=Cyprideis torosa TaxID=163714 RepID=A0A7R8ZJ01_9CRUS|nr:unnamed protein product [Cyprideis torosa]CAG0887503.1 unnamed protein product [Cyprideis torosa]
MADKDDFDGDDDVGGGGDEFEQEEEDHLDDELEQQDDDDHQINVLRPEEAGQSVPKDQRITTPYMTKYERARVLGARALQIAMCAPVMVELEGETDPLAIAMKELKQRKIPLIIRRYLPDGSHEDWAIDELAGFVMTLLYDSLQHLPPAHIPCPPEDIQGDGRWHSIHRRYCSEARVAEPDVLFVGDSIIGHMPRTSTIWQRWFAPLHSLNFGVSGDCTQHLLWRLQNGELDCIRPKAIVVEIGTNNYLHSATDVMHGISAVVDTIREKQPQAKIFLCTILPRGEYPNRLREKNRETNLLLKAKYGSPGAKGDLVRTSKLGTRDSSARDSSGGGDGQSVTKKSRSNSGSGKPIEILMPPNASPPPVALMEIDAGFVQADGTISHKDMYDFLHLSADGYEKAFSGVNEALREYLRVDEDDVPAEEEDAVFRSASLGTTGEEVGEEMTMAELDVLSVQVEGQQRVA